MDLKALYGSTAPRLLEGRGPIRRNGKGRGAVGHNRKLSKRNFLQQIHVLLEEIEPLRVLRSELCKMQSHLRPQTRQYASTADSASFSSPKHINNPYTFALAEVWRDGGHATKPAFSAGGSSDQHPATLRPAQRQRHPPLPASPAPAVGP